MMPCSLRAFSVVPPFALAVSACMSMSAESAGAMLQHVMLELAIP